MIEFLQPSATKKSFAHALEDFHHMPKGLWVVPAFAKMEVKLLRAALTGVVETVQRLALWALSKIHHRFQAPPSVKAPLIGTYLSVQGLFVAAKADRIYQNWQSQAKTSINKLFDDNIRDFSDSCLRRVTTTTPDPIEHQVWGKKVQKLEEEFAEALNALRAQVIEEDDLVTQSAEQHINERIGEHKTVFLERLEQSPLTQEELALGYRQAAQETVHEYFTELFEQTFSPETLARRYEKSFDTVDMLPILNALNEEKADIEEQVEKIGETKDFRHTYRKIMEALDAVEEKIDRVVDEVALSPSEEAEPDFEKQATDNASRIFKQLQARLNNELRVACLKGEMAEPTDDMLDSAIQMQTRVTAALSKKIEAVAHAEDPEEAYQTFLQSLDAFTQKSCQEIDKLFVPKSEPTKASFFSRIHLRYTARDSKIG